MSAILDCNSASVACTQVSLSEIICALATAHSSARCQKASTNHLILLYFSSAIQVTLEANHSQVLISLSRAVEKSQVQTSVVSTSCFGIFTFVVQISIFASGHLTEDLCKLYLSPIVVN